MSSKEDLLDEIELSKNKLDELFSSVRWWEKKRILFNIIVIGTQLFVMLVMLNETTLFGIPSAIINSLFYLLAANLFYCLGWGLEILSSHYLPGRELSKDRRSALFVLGLVFSTLITLGAYSLTLGGI